MKRYVRIACLFLCLIFIPLILKDSIDNFIPRNYDSELSTFDKFRMVVPYIPKNSQIVLAIDTWKLSRDAALLKEVMSLSENAQGLIVDIVRGMMSAPDFIGMIVVVGEIDKDSANVAAIVQAGFNKERMLVSINESLATISVNLTPYEIEDDTIFYAENDPDKFAFSFLDDRHLILGSADYIRRVLEGDSPFKESEEIDELAVFGWFDFSSLLNDSAPQSIEELGEVFIKSADGKVFSADIDCKTEESAIQARFFIDGLRSLIAAEYFKSPKAIAFLEDLVIGRNKNRVLINGDISKAF